MCPNVYLQNVVFKGSHHYANPTQRVGLVQREHNPYLYLITNYVVLAMLYHCSRHVISLFSPCYIIVLAMSYHCSRHVISLFLPCDIIVLAILYHCSRHVISLFSQCYIIVLAMLYHYSRHVISLFICR